MSPSLMTVRSVPAAGMRLAAGGAGGDVWLGPGGGGRGRRCEDDAGVGRARAALTARTAADAEVEAPEEEAKAEGRGDGQAGQRQERRGGTAVEHEGRAPVAPTRRSRRLPHAGTVAPVARACSSVPSGAVSTISSWSVS